MLVRIRPLASLSISGASGLGFQVGCEGGGFGVTFSPSGRCGVGSGSVVRMGVSQQVCEHGAAQFKRSFKVSDCARRLRGSYAVPEAIEPQVDEIGHGAEMQLTPLDEPQLRLKSEGALFGHALSAFSSSLSKIRASIAFTSAMSSR